MKNRKAVKTQNGKKDGEISLSRYPFSLSSGGGQSRLCAGVVNKNALIGPTEEQEAY